MLLLRVNKKIFGIWFGTHLIIASDVGFVAKAQYEVRCTKYGLKNRDIPNIIALVLFNLYFVLTGQSEKSNTTEIALLNQKERLLHINNEIHNTNISKWLELRIN